MRINIIGDIAGRYDEMLKLLAKMPEADLVLSVGDMVDRGPQSKQVIKWFMKMQKAGKAEAIYGNHEDMMVEGLSRGNSRDWMYNGGQATLRSYLKKGEKDIQDAMVPKSHVDWLQKRPMYFQTDDLFVSHAPVTTLRNAPTDPYSRDYFFVWNRYEPSKPQSKFMIYGHNGSYKVHKWGDGSEFAICVDNSHHAELTGIHWPTKEVFTQKFRELEEFEALPVKEQEKLKKKAEEENKKTLAALSMFF